MALNELDWGNPYRSQGEKFDRFWNTYLNEGEKNLLYILGMGFDPRTTLGIEKILSMGGIGRRHCRVIEYKRKVHGNTSRHEDKIRDNEVILNLLDHANSSLSCDKEVIVLTSEDSRNIADRSASALFDDPTYFEQYTDVLIDISAMPRGIYIPLINKLITIFQQRLNITINLHVIICENSEMDSFIKSDGRELEASSIHGLKVKEINSNANEKRVWIPILGENRRDQMQKIYDYINPDEICPVVPFPSLNIRRGDQLISVYRDLLFGQFDIQENNIMYADERNPFQTYRIIMQAIERYHRTFKLLHGCKIYISSLSSKLLSVGAILAVYESRRKSINSGMVQVSSLGHKLESDKINDSVLNQSELFHLWIHGHPYAINE